LISAELLAPLGERVVGGVLVAEQDARELPLCPLE
jgi:hypothetical protein